MPDNESPVEIFKRSTAAALRAIARRGDVTVTYGAEPAGAAGARIRLPLPPRDLAEKDAAPVRGAADALGSRNMVGVAGNLAAMLDERYRRQGYEQMAERNDVTLAEAIRLLVRERLTGAPPPPAARQVVELWRPYLEGKVGRDLIELERHMRDQATYARTSRQLI